MRNTNNKQILKHHLLSVIINTQWARCLWSEVVYCYHSTDQEDLKWNFFHRWQNKSSLQGRLSHSEFSNLGSKHRGNRSLNRGIWFPLCLLFGLFANVNNSSIFIQLLCCNFDIGGYKYDCRPFFVLWGGQVIRHAKNVQLMERSFRANLKYCKRLTLPEEVTLLLVAFQYYGCDSYIWCNCERKEKPTCFAITSFVAREGGCYP